MKSPVFDRRHIKEYLLAGSLAAVMYMIPVSFFLRYNSYQHLYYLFIGCALFMATIFFYCYKLLYSRYDKKRAVSMLIAGHLATLTGIVIALLLVVLSMFIFKLNPLSATASPVILKGAAPQVEHQTGSNLLMMICLTCLIGNFATGSFITVIVSYAGKLDQTKDRPVNLGE